MVGEGCVRGEGGEGCVRGEGGEGSVGCEDGEGGWGGEVSVAWCKGRDRRDSCESCNDWDLLPSWEKQWTGGKDSEVERLW